jgi:predicted DNA-binding transcriptional regulator AlpA
MPEPQTLPQFLRFRDLKASGVAANWPQLRTMISEYGFPPGRLLSPSVRVWTTTEVRDWLDQRPTDAASRSMGRRRADYIAAAAEQKPAA